MWGLSLAVKPLDILEFLICVWLGLCIRGRKAKQPIALDINRANTLIVLVTCLDTMGLRVWAYLLTPVGKSTGWLFLATPVNIWRVRKGPGRWVKWNTCWRVCLFFCAGKSPVWVDPEGFCPKYLQYAAKRNCRVWPGGLLSTSLPEGDPKQCEGAGFPARLVSAWGRDERKLNHRQQMSLILLNIEHHGGREKNP